MAELLLDVNDLKVHFATQDGTVRAVDGVSFTLERGKVLGIVGESGSGKSVTAMTLMGLTRDVNSRFEGKVLYKGTDLLQVSDSGLQAYRGNEIGMIFQDPMTSLNPVYRIGEQIAEAIRTHETIDKRGARRRAVELLRQVGIPNPDSRVDDYPHQFSGGMRQRAMIAMALSCNPDDLIADEPTTSGLRSEEHTSELQSRRDLVCRLLLEKKKQRKSTVLRRRSLGGEIRHRYFFDRSRYARGS